jgi:hypothetical protein
MTNRSVQKLHDLEEVVKSIVFVDNDRDQGLAKEARRRSLLLLGVKALLEAEQNRPVLIVIAGGTNVGKSTIFNQLAGVAASDVSPLARRTKCPVAWASEAALKLLVRSPFIPGVDVGWSTKATGASEASTPTVKLVPADDDPYRGVVIIDSPDLDSDHLNNRVWAERLMVMSDAVILVVTPEKYNDAAVVQFLQEAASLRRSLAVVFNKTEGEEAHNDFLRKIARPIDRNIPVIQQGILHNEDAFTKPLADLQRVVLQWSRSSRHIKNRALEGALSSLTATSRELMAFFWEEQMRLVELHDELDRVMGAVVENYEAQLEGQKFDELDLVFRRLLADLHIPIIDDFYDGVKAIGTAVWSRLGGFVRIPRNKVKMQDQQRIEERQRVIEAARSCRVRIGALLERPTGFSRELAATWRQHVPDVPTDDDIDTYLADVDRAVQTWIQEETLSITRNLRDKPGFRNFVIGAKAVVQLGSGVAGALLTGGIHPSDLAVIPAVERMTAFLIERGLGYPYFVRCRARLLGARSAVLASFLDSRLLQPVRTAMPPADQITAARLAAAIDTIPKAKELMP